MCVICHLRPGADATELSVGLYPSPPRWDQLGDVAPREAFWVLKHGIKATGMPAFGETHGDAELLQIVAIVRERLADVGELAAPGTPLAVLLDAERLEVSAQVQARDVRSLGAAKEIFFEGEGGRRSLALLRISPAIDPQSRTVEARFRFAGAAAPPGASGRIAWRDSQPHAPAALLVRRGAALGVFIDEDGTARFRALPGAQEGRPAPLELAPGTPVVVSGQLALEDGQKLDGQKLR